MKRELEQRDWIQVKRRYIYTDISYKALSEELGCLRQTVMSNLKKRFPNVNLKERKAEEKLKRESAEILNNNENAEIERIKTVNSLDLADGKHLDIVNLLLDEALKKCEEGTIQVKNIKDIISLMDMHRTILDKRTTSDKVIVIRAEIPEKVDELPEVIDTEFEEV